MVHPWRNISACKYFYPRTSRNHWSIWSDLHWGKRLDIDLDSKWNAWPEVGRKNFQLPLENTSRKIWLWNNAPHPRNMETHLLRYCLHPRSGGLWCKVFKQTRCGAPQECLEINIPCDHRLDRIKKLGLNLKWNYITRTVNIYMSDYVPEALHKFQNKAP